MFLRVLIPVMIMMLFATNMLTVSYANSRSIVTETNHAVSEQVLEDARAQLLQSVRAAEGTVSAAMLPTYTPRVALCSTENRECNKTAQVAFAIVGGTDVAPNNDGTDSIAPNVNTGIGQVIVPVKISVTILAGAGNVVERRTGMAKYSVYPQTPYGDEIGFEDSSSTNGVTGTPIRGEMNSAGCGVTDTDCHPNAVQAPTSTLLTANQNCVSSAMWSCTGAPPQPDNNNYQTLTDANENNSAKAGAFGGNVAP